MKFGRELFISLCILWNIFTVNSLVVRNEHSLYGPYDGTVEGAQQWTMMGSAQHAGNVLRLTTEEPHKQGSIWNNFPVLTDNWELHMIFHIYGQSVNLGGNGMAIWYARDPFQAGPIFGARDYFNGLGVFIDTTGEFDEPHHHLHPYVSAVVNNGTLAYQHHEDGTAYQVGGCHMPIRNAEKPVKIAVSYIHNTLTLFFDVQNNGQWIECFRTGGVYLPTAYSFGISASTGEYSDTHDIIEITTLDMNLPDKEHTDRSHIIPQSEYIQVLPKAPKEDKAEVHQEIKMDIVKEKVEEKGDEVHHDEVIGEKIETSQGTSLIVKIIYVIGFIVLLIIAIGQCKKYSAQRREKMQKRLF